MLLISVHPDGKRQPLRDRLAINPRARWEKGRLPIPGLQLGDYRSESGPLSSAYGYCYSTLNSHSCIYFGDTPSPQPSDEVTDARSSEAEEDGTIGIC